MSRRGFDGPRNEQGRRPGGKRPGAGRPGAKRFEGQRPEGGRPEGGRPGPRRSEGKRPGGKRFESRRPGDTTRFESRRPGPRPEAAVPPDRAGRAPPEDGCVWGLNPVLEYLRGKPGEIERLLLAEGSLDRGPAAEVLSRAREAGIHVERVDRERLNRLSGNGVHQGIVAEVKQYQYLELSELSKRARASGRQPLLVVLDGVQDPHNLGAIIRSAHALGAHGVVVPKDRAAQVTGSVVKAAAGALAHCPVGRVTNVARAIEQLRDEGFWSVVLSPEGGSPLFDLKLDGPLVLVIGSEGEGVRQLVASKCDFRATIPMEGRVASLNASVSAAIALYEIARQRLAAVPALPVPG